MVLCISSFCYHRTKGVKVSCFTFHVLLLLRVFFVFLTLSHGVVCWYVICDYGFLVSYSFSKA